MSKCFLLVSIAGSNPRKIVIKLDIETCPKTCSNFLSFCTSTDERSYKNTIIHRVCPGFVVQGGDYQNGDGSGGEAYDGQRLQDENFDIKHDEPFILSMANRGKDTAGSQFFITLGKAHHLDGKHVAFGRVVEGTDVVRDMEKVETDEKDKPVALQKIKIVDCGVGDGEIESSSDESLTTGDRDRAKHNSSRKDKKKSKSRSKRDKKSKKSRKADKYDSDSEDSTSSIDERRLRKRHKKSKSTSSRKHKRKHSYSSSSDDDSNGSYHKKRKKSRKRKHYDGDDDDDESLEQSRSRKHKKSSSRKESKKRRRKYNSSDNELPSDSSDESRSRSRSTSKKSKKKKDSKSSRHQETSTISYNSKEKSFGMYGIIKESDLRTSTKVKRNFTIWLEGVKGIPQGTNVPKWEMAEAFKEYAEDFNTATLPHEKYYDYDKWELEEYNRRKEDSTSKKGVISDEFQFQEERKKQEEDKRKKELEMVKYTMSKEKIDEMKRQAHLKAELVNAYRVGDEETRKKLQRRLEPDEK